MSVGSDMIHFTGRPVIALGSPGLRSISIDYCNLSDSGVNNRKDRTCDVMGLMAEFGRKRKERISTCRSPEKVMTRFPSDASSALCP